MRLSFYCINDKSYLSCTYSIFFAWMKAVWCQRMKERQILLLGAFPELSLQNTWKLAFKPFQTQGIFFAPFSAWTNKSLANATDAHQKSLKFCIGAWVSFVKSLLSHLEAKETLTRRITCYEKVESSVFQRFRFIF